MRISAFIMLCLGVQIFWDGARELLLAMIAQSALAIPVPNP